MKTRLQPRPLTLSIVAAILASGCGSGGGGTTASSPGACLSASSPVTTVQRMVALKDAPTQVSAGLDVYASTTSALRGERVTFHLSDNAAAPGVTRGVPYTITRRGLADREVARGTVPGVGRQSIPDDAWIDCCNWPVSLDVLVGADWTSGLYEATFTLGSVVKRVQFVVRNPTTAPGARIVVQVPFHTARAYNNWGGKSAYAFNSSNGVQAPRLSMFRPNNDPDTSIEQWLIPLIVWAERQGFALDYISGDDMQRVATVLEPYAMFVTAGHDEYWSSEMRSELERFVARGGHAAIFSGNTMWWRIGHAPDGFGRPYGVMEVARRSGSPYANWYEIEPEGKLILSSFVRGGFRGSLGSTTVPYTVHRNEHWVFDGVGVSRGSQFGGTESLHAYEGDGIDFTLNAAGLPIATGADGAPADTTILALASLTRWDATALVPGVLNLTGQGGAWAAMTIREHVTRGTVFNGGTTEWGAAMKPCALGTGTSVVCDVTRNLFNRLGAALAPSPAPTPAPPPTAAPAPAPNC